MDFGQFRGAMPVQREAGPQKAGFFLPGKASDSKPMVGKIDGSILPTIRFLREALQIYVQTNLTH